MSEPLIRVRDLWKRYDGVLGFQLKSLLLGKGDPGPVGIRWALQAIDFEVARGESFAVIGHNGSGKTTLLSLLLGAIAPTRGEIEIRGRVASLLTLGAGFHPELSGRDNVYLYASILGMRRAEIDKVFDSIIEFAELWDVVDVPVRIYSSGMNARLGFSTIIHVPVDILLVDEILGVGDEHFGKKCARFFDDFRARGGTLVTVSHALGRLRQLCDRGLYLRAGHQIACGSVDEAIDTYTEEVRTGQAQRSQAVATG